MMGIKINQSKQPNRFYGNKKKIQEFIPKKRKKSKGKKKEKNHFVVCYIFVLQFSIS